MGGQEAMDEDVDTEHRAYGILFVGQDDPRVLPGHLADRAQTGHAGGCRMKRAHTAWEPGPSAIRRCREGHQTDIVVHYTPCEFAMPTARK